MCFGLDIVFGVVVLEVVVDEYGYLVIGED